MSIQNDPQKEDCSRASLFRDLAATLAPEAKDQLEIKAGTAATVAKEVVEYATEKSNSNSISTNFKSGLKFVSSILVEFLCVRSAKKAFDDYFVKREPHRP